MILKDSKNILYIINEYVDGDVSNQKINQNSFNFALLVAGKCKGPLKAQLDGLHQTLRGHLRMGDCFTFQVTVLHASSIAPEYSEIFCNFKLALNHFYVFCFFLHNLLSPVECLTTSINLRFINHDQTFSTELFKNNGHHVPFQHIQNVRSQILSINYVPFQCVKFWKMLCFYR